MWGLYFDREDDGLRGIGADVDKHGKRRRMLMVELTRKEVMKEFAAAREERMERLREMARKEKAAVEERLVQEVDTSAEGSREESESRGDDKDAEVEAEGDNEHEDVMIEENVCPTEGPVSHD